MKLTDQNNRPKPWRFKKSGYPGKSFYTEIEAKEYAVNILN